MPQKAIDYSNTSIYKLVCNDLQVKHIYVGHTTNFNDRKRRHKGTCQNQTNKHYDLKVYRCIRENGGWDNWSMIEIEKFSCQDRQEACARERLYYEELNADLNSVCPFVTNEELKPLGKVLNNNPRQEYWKNRKSIKAEYDKEYRKQNNDKLNERIVCECGGSYLMRHKSTHCRTGRHKHYLNDKPI
jgi:hypothetical protein